MRLSPPTISQLQKIFLRLDGLNAMLGPLRSEVLAGDALRIGSPTLMGRPIRVYGDNAGGHALFFDPSARELYVSDLSADPTAWDKALAYIWAGKDQAEFDIQSDPSLGDYGYMTFSVNRIYPRFFCISQQAVGNKNVMFSADAYTLLNFQDWERNNQMIWISALTGSYPKGLHFYGDDIFLGLGRTGAGGLPAASAFYRGRLVTVEGGAGVADVLYMCMKRADDSYAWIQVASG